MKSKTSLVLVLIIFGILVISWVPSHADDVLFGCVLKEVGTIRLIDNPATSKCRPNEYRVTLTGIIGWKIKKTIAQTGFEEASIGDTFFIPGSGDVEMAWTTSTAGSAQALVAEHSGNQTLDLIGASGAPNAIAIFGPIDVSTFSNVQVSFDWANFITLGVWESDPLTVTCSWTGAPGSPAQKILNNLNAPIGVFNNFQACTVLDGAISLTLTIQGNFSTNYEVVGLGPLNCVEPFLIQDLITQLPFRVPFPLCSL